MNTMSQKTLGLTQIALFTAIILVLAMVPGLGYIPVGVIRATTIHIPVIAASILMGPKKGAVLGGIFGLTSMINNTISPTITSFVFSPVLAMEMGGAAAFVKALAICMLPRILIGVVPYFVYQGLRKAGRQQDWLILPLAAAGVAGSMTNTLLVMNGIYFLFGKDYAAAKEMTLDGFYTAVIVPVVGINGVIEAVVAAIIVTAIVRVFFKSRLAVK